MKKWLQLREQELNAARAALSEAEGRVDQAQAALRDIQQNIQREMQAACAMLAGDAAVESFAAWLPTARQREARAEAALASVEDDATLARNKFNLAHGALAGAQKYAERIAEEERAAERKKEQADLMEIVLNFPQRRF